MDVSSVPPDLAPGVWAKFKKEIDRALSHGEGDSTTSAHLLAQIIAGRMQLWVVHEGDDLIACLVISIHTYTAKTTVAIEIAAGRDLDRWVERVEQLLMDFKTLVGADTIECSCRPGLAHRLMRRGWRRKAITMELK